MPPSFPSPGWTGRETYQTILNAHPIPPRARQRAMDPVKVLARVVWSDDGPQTIAGHVDVYCGRLVLVHTTDLRLRIRSVWLDADDVQRVPPADAI